MTPHTARRNEQDSQAPSLEAGVAHDFKNLLFVITAHCQRLIQTLEPEDSRRRDAEAIAAFEERARHMRFLQSRGFSFEVIRAVLQDDLGELGDIDSDVSDEQ